MASPATGGRALKAGALLLAVALGLPGCAERTPVQKAGLDQDISRDINWQFRADRRLVEVNAYCIDRVVTLEGRVGDQAALAEALRIAKAYSRGAPVVSKVEIQPR